MITNNENREPDLRFPGFTEPWEHRKLGDLAERVTRKNTNNESSLPLTISAQYGLIDQMEFFGKRIASHDISGYYLLYNGEFAYNKSTSGDAPWGAVKRLDRYENGAVSTLYIVFAIKDVEQTDSDFLACYYNTNLWHSGVQAVAAEGARNHGLLNIAASDFFNTTLSIPSDIEEQRMIGAFFNKVDDLITLHQRKCDELKLYKRGLLQQLFSQPEELYPHVRFPGFGGPWQKRKFEDIFTVSQGLQIPISERYMEPGANRYFYITNEFLKEDCKEAYYIENPSKSVVCDEEDILMTRTGNTGIVVTDVAGCFHNNFFKIAYDKQAYSKRFICYLLSSPAMHKIIMRNAGSSTIPDLSHKNFYKIDAAFPESKEEQERIGKLLFDMDKLIALHQQKCKELRVYKQGLLQHMFVRPDKSI